MCNTTKCHRKRNVVSGSRNNQTVSSAANKRRSRSHNAHAHTQTHQLKAAKGFTGKQTPSIVPRATTMTRMRHQVGSLSFVLTLMAVVILNNFGCLISPTATTQVYAAASAQRENTRILPLQSGELEKCFFVFILRFYFFCPILEDLFLFRAQNGKVFQKKNHDNGHFYCTLHGVRV